jgi:hypothetical protein
MVNNFDTHIDTQKGEQSDTKQEWDVHMGIKLFTSRFITCYPSLIWRL